MFDNSKYIKHDPPTVQEASTAYRAAKKADIERVAHLQDCQRTRDGLLRHADLFAPEFDLIA